MSIPFVDLNAQYKSIKDEIDTAIALVIERSAFVGGSSNSFVLDFETSFAKFVGVEHCIGCANGTDSLEILLKAYGIGVGDEVIVPALTWISTSEAVSNVGAKPVFVDIHPNFYTIDIEKIEEKISFRTKAIIPVHLYGLPADMDEIILIAKKHQLIIIEDCAQAHGAKFHGKSVGTMGHAASFSFFPGKNLGAYGDAGAMVTNDEQIAAKVRMIANHGQAGKHNHLMEGRNSRLDGINAAILSVKLRSLDQWNERRKEKAIRYQELLSESPLVLPLVADDTEHVFHLFVVQLPDSVNRNQLMQSLKSVGIETAIHYPLPLPLLPAYANKGYTEVDCTVAQKLCSCVLSLPIYPEITSDQQQFVADTLLKMLK